MLLFNIIIITICFLDFFILNKFKNTTRTAAILTIVWIICGIGFAFPVGYILGSNKAFEYLSAYFIEKTLSIDNLFVFFYIFSYFKIPFKEQPRILFIGIFSAIFFRFIAIYTTFSLLTAFSFLIYPLALFLISCGVLSLISEAHFSFKQAQKIKHFFLKVPFVRYSNESDFILKYTNKTIFITHSFFALIAIEFSDVLFAADSIPAIFSVTTDKALAYISNIFAILGLRAMYHLFALSMTQIYYLKPAIAIIMILVGLKMGISNIIHISPIYSFSTLITILVTAIIASWLRNKRK